MSDPAEPTEQAEPTGQAEPTDASAGLLGWPVISKHGRLLAFAPDLMDRSKILAARPDTSFLKGAAELDDGASVSAADVLLVDLNRTMVLDRLAGCPARIIGFVSHVDAETAQRARSAGVEVLARSAFFRRLHAAHP
ncbi:MAG: hypothetical protein ACKV2O_07575 [Acidimicrobiales bacterium]